MGEPWAHLLLPEGVAKGLVIRGVLAHLCNHCKNGFTLLLTVNPGNHSKQFCIRGKRLKRGHGTAAAEGPRTTQVFAAFMPRFLDGFLHFKGKGSFLLICLANIFWLVFRDDYKKCVEKPDMVPRVAVEDSRRPQGWAEGVQGWVG